MIIKYVFILFVVVVNLMEGSLENTFPSSEQIPNSDRAMMQVMDKTSEELKHKYNLHPIGFGMRGQDKFKGVSLEYKVFKKLTKDEARFILFEAVEKFVDNINKNLFLKDELEVYPFANSNVGVTLYIEHENGKEVFHPDICVARWYSKGVYFHTEDPKTHRFKEEIAEETHEEALELVRQYRAAQIAQSSESK